MARLAEDCYLQKIEPHPNEANFLLEPVNAGLSVNSYCSEQFSQGYFTKNGKD